MTEHAGARAHTLVADVGHPQGPDVFPSATAHADSAPITAGTIVYAETYLSRLMTWTPLGGSQVLASTGGGPNAVLVGSDGRVYYTQNGGQAGEWRADDQRPAAIIALDPATGSSETLCTAVGGRPLLAPHDLAWGPDGRLYVTDSGTWAPGGDTEPGAIIAIGDGPTAELIHDTGHVFPSGIAFDRDGLLYWAECYTGRILRRALAAGSPVEVWATVPEGHTPESLAIDENGRIWVAALEAGGFDVFASDGSWESSVTTGGLPLNGVLYDGLLIVTDLGDYDESKPDPQIIGRIQSIEVGVGPLPLPRSRIVTESSPS